LEGGGPGRGFVVLLGEATEEGEEVVEAAEGETAAGGGGKAVLVGRLIPGAGVLLTPGAEPPGVFGVPAGREKEFIRGETMPPPVLGEEAEGPAPLEGMRARLLPLTSPTPTPPFGFVGIELE